MLSIIGQVKNFLSRLSFRTGVVLVILCVICYIVSFAQMLLPISVTAKGVLWVVFFGLAKTFQYSALAVLGVEGVKRVKSWWKNRK
jgi:phosphoglycolate phosphatase